MGFLRHGQRKPRGGASAPRVSTEWTPAAGSPAGGSQADDSPTGSAQVGGTIIDDLNEKTPARPEEPNVETPAVSFLETKQLPTTEPEFSGLPEIGRRFSDYRKNWLSSPYALHLAKIISQVIEDRKDSPISNAVLLGVGGAYASIHALGEHCDREQFFVFSQICAALATNCPSLLQNIVVQDPQMTPRWRTVFEAYGCKVVEDPEAFSLIGPNTFLFSAWVEPQYLFPGLEGRPIDELPLYVGNDTRWYAKEDPAQKETTDALFSTVFCSTVAIPCATVGSRYEGKFNPDHGLSGLSLWWRPFRTESQKQQDAALRSFASACNAGFTGNFVEFLRAYRLGFASLPGQEQQRFVYHYIAHLDRKGEFNRSPPRCPDFGEVFRRYVDAEAESTSEEHDLYQATIDAYLAGLKDGKPSEELFQAFLKRMESATLR